MKPINHYKLNKSFGVGVALLSAVAGASGQVLYSDNFDSGSGDAANWNVNVPTGGNNSATFGFDYSTLGIPSAPNAGGTTIGLRLLANPTAGSTPSANGLSVSPVGQSFTGNFRLTFDLWQNYTGPAATGGSGSTQLSGGGVGTSGTVPQYFNSTPTSIYFQQTGDGGNGTTSQDYHAYKPGGPSGIGLTAASGVFAAGTDATAIDNANAYYAPLGAHTVPAAQTALFPAQTGTTPAGAPGFAWVQVTIDKDGDNVSYKLNNTLIATITGVSGLTLSGNNIELNQSDVNNSVSSSPNLVVGIFDDVVVTAPEPSTYALGLAGVAGFFMMRRRRK